MLTPERRAEIALDAKKTIVARLRTTAPSEMTECRLLTHEEVVYADTCYADIAEYLENSVVLVE
jgi:hypothetical protein